MKHSLRVLILYGGYSGEREVSLRSGANVATHVRDHGHDVILADPAADGFDLEWLANTCDIVLPILHGAGGEDGVLQAQLEKMGKPFFGSGSVACRLTFDKAAYRTFITEQGIQMAAGEVVNRQQFKSSKLRQKPYVLKPVDGGSSVDTVILHDLSDEPDDSYFDELFSRYETMLLEELIEGHELTVGVLEDKPLPVILIVPPESETFDYENKYNGRTQEIVKPKNVSATHQRKAQQLALKIHKLTGCRHMSRTDMILAQDGTLYVLETNTIPGLTDQSLLPKSAAAAGHDMAALVSRFVNLAEAL